MTQSSGVDDFFDNSVRSGAPSIKLSEVNDGVLGEIVDQFKVEAKKFGTDEVELDRKTNQPIMQLVIVLQTSLRNWERVSKVPLIDPADKSKGFKDPSEDDGKRAVYVKPFTNIHAAIGKATAVHNGGRPSGLRNGATLGVKIERLEDVDKGNPKRVFAAVYTPPAAGSDAEFFGNQNTAGGPGDASQAPAPQQAAQTPPQQDPWSGQAAEPSQPAQAAQNDPWGAPQGGQEPPF